MSCNFIQTCFKMFLYIRIIFKFQNRVPIHAVVQKLNRIEISQARSGHRALTEEFLLVFLAVNKDEHRRASSSASIQHFPAALVGARNMR